MDDPEIKAYAECSAILKKLDEATRNMVMRWLSDKFQPTNVFPMPSGSVGKSGSGTTASSRNSRESALDYSDIAHKMGKANIKSVPARALIVGHWLQNQSTNRVFLSRQLFAVMNKIGLRPTNMSLASIRLTEKKPKLVVQVGRDGGQKKYQVTADGAKLARELLKETDNN